MPYLHTPISALSGVGAARKAAYEKMGVYTVEDLLYHFPRAYEHRGDNPYTRRLLLRSSVVALIWMIVC